MQIHVVNNGDSLYTIGRRFGVNHQKIARDNGINPGETLVVGQAIVIMGVGEKAKLGTVKVNGYAYANIAEDVLDKTLPYLTFLSLFSYEALENGDIKPIAVSAAEDKAIAKAIDSNVKPAMVITNIGASGNFEPELAQAILNNPQVVDKLINNVLETMRAKKYAGLDVDFEFVLPQDREAYNNFLAKCAEKMHENGFFISCAIPAKEAESTTDALSGAYDYAAIGSIVDYVILMTYEWGYATSGAMAVAPIINVENTLKFAVSQIPPSKILMGIPNYGYDWPTPASRQNPGRAISNTAAAELARKHNQTINFDEDAQTPFFVYFDEAGKRREVWFEDARSVKAKLELAAKYKLGGFSYWTINSFWPQNWLILNTMYNISRG
ncbi:MAG: LysM peptidoglycan-binding domain-containing protein [Clostridiales bacterium]|jgi:spore germination protein|nr:LysM peptidoglycan-binding domain-containing protein [Clostridiales bacterium]